jgi:hypothetical protein
LEISSRISCIANTFPYDLQRVRPKEELEFQKGSHKKTRQLSHRPIRQGME